MHLSRQSPTHQASTADSKLTEQKKLKLILGCLMMMKSMKLMMSFSTTLKKEKSTKKQKNKPKKRRQKTSQLRCPSSSSMRRKDLRTWIQLFLRSWMTKPQKRKLGGLRRWVLFRWFLQTLKKLQNKYPLQSQSKKCTNGLLQSL